MEKFRALYLGHSRDARKALTKLGLATEKELAYLSDADVEERLNESGHLIFESGDDFVVVPKEYQDKIIWICR